MNYQKAIEYIENLASSEQKRPGLPSLKRIKAFLSFYQSPQNAFKAFHVGGTNGKGSTVAMLDTILRRSKSKIGRFTGPHLLRFNERFHIDGQPISDIEFAQRVATLKSQSESFSLLNPVMGELSWFEFLTTLAFFYFAQNNVDIAVMEVGLGGRFDATNVLQNIYATGITNIALDHEHILGSSLELIAMEKAGIIKAGIPTITNAQEPALGVISKRAQEIGSALLVCDSQKQLNNKIYSQICQKLYDSKNDICRHGFYQYHNALVALNMVQQAGLLTLDTLSDNNKDASNYQITIDHALQQIRNFYWPGRFQIIESDQIILDGAHNPAGIKALRESLDYLLPNQKFHFIFGCYQDKDGLAMLKKLLREGDCLYLVDISDKRSSFDLSSLTNFAQEKKVKVNNHSTVSQALAQARDNRRVNEFIVACGSFVTVRALVQSLGWKTVEDTIN